MLTSQTKQIAVLIMKPVHTITNTILNTTVTLKISYTAKDQQRRQHHNQDNQDRNWQLGNIGYEVCLNAVGCFLLQPPLPSTTKHTQTTTPSIIPTIPPLPSPQNNNDQITNNSIRSRQDKGNHPIKFNWRYSKPIFLLCWNLFLKGNQIFRFFWK